MPREYVLHPFQAPVNPQIDYANELNAQQLTAVTAPPGPALVIAGAGAGKTRTLVYRVAYLLEQGIPPDRILLLTFTNKAAKEMMRRVSDLLGGDYPSLWGGTFHSIGHRVLRRHADQLGFRKDFTILDREDAKDLIKLCIAEAKIEPTEMMFPKAEVLQDVFSLAANMAQPVAALIETHYDHLLALTTQIGVVAQRYQARKRLNGLVDFDDLQSLWVELLRDHDSVRELFQRRFQFVLVDEYQDTNSVQGELIDLLAAGHHNLMVVGDDSQSIYSWRGANFQNILEFPKRYPEAKVYKIETNYRSTPEILLVANAVIHANAQQFEKTLTPSRRSGTKPVLASCSDAIEQAVFVAQRVLLLRDEGVDLNKMAVLYRSHFHSMELQMELTKRGVPFSITSGIRYFEQAHVKDVAAYLKLVCNPLDELAFKRLVLLLPGIGGSGANKLWQQFHPRAIRLLDPSSPSGDSSGAALLLDHGSGVPAPNPKQAIAAALQACSKFVPGKATRAWADFVITISQLELALPKQSPGLLVKLILEAGYEAYLKETFPNYRSRREDLEQLSNYALQFDEVPEFLAQLALVTNLEAEEEKPVARGEERLRLSTIHQAKGLEFDVVFIIMLSEGLFPSRHSLENPESEEEERRLFYVAVTRARNELYLSFPLIRTFANQVGQSFQHPSRFIEEIPIELLDEWGLRT